MSIGRCKDCKHYGVKKAYQCDSDKFCYGYYPNPDEVLPSDGAIIENDEGWGMLIGPDFGCIHWEAKST